MGCSVGDKECTDDEPNPPIHITIERGFFIGETEVTQAAYKRMTGGNPSHFKGPNRPVDNVTSSAAKSYCSSIEGRLPRDEEWEYALRSGTTGSRYGTLDDIAWYHENSGAQTHEVKQKVPNAWGLYDMLGNVWEWTSGNGESTILRGGYFNGPEKYERSSYNDSHLLSIFSYLSHNKEIGFRCVWD
jgi:formylglycine-generating enzyme required for sulfatase activity